MINPALTWGKEDKDENKAESLPELPDFGKMLENPR